MKDKSGPEQSELRDRCFEALLTQGSLQAPAPALLTEWQDSESDPSSYLPEPGLLVTWALLPGSLKTLISWTTEMISLDLMLGSGSWACWNIKIKYEAIHSTQYSWWLPTSCPHSTLPNFSTSTNAVSFSTYSGFCKVITYAPPPQWSLNKLTKKFKPVCALKRLPGSFFIFLTRPFLYITRFVLFTQYLKLKNIFFGGRIHNSVVNILKIKQKKWDLKDNSIGREACGVFEVLIVFYILELVDTLWFILWLFLEQCILSILSCNNTFHSFNNSL